MKVRDSGMPDEELRSSLFSPAETQLALGLKPGDGDVVEFGCGYGTFTIPAAQITTGRVYALDIDPAMIAGTGAKAHSGLCDRRRNCNARKRSPQCSHPAQSSSKWTSFKSIHLERSDFWLWLCPADNQD